MIANKIPGSLLLVATVLAVQGSASGNYLSYLDAKPVLEAIRSDLLPAELQDHRGSELAALWPKWVVRHDLDVRARLKRGDEDSLVNLVLFGTTFTNQPRIRDQEIIALASEARTDQLAHADVVQGRIKDLVTAMGSPEPNERLRFARDVLRGQNIDPGTSSGQAEAIGCLQGWVQRVLVDYERFFQISKDSTLFRDRGLSSDTSIFPDFAIDRAFDAMKSGGLLKTAGVRRVGIVGPGLDFADKREGYDFYPQQTLQPFAVADSLLRMGLATPQALRLTTLDISERVNDHLKAARRRAVGGSSYVMQLPRETDFRWNPELVAYWKQVGASIGNEVRAADPVGARNVEMRAIGVRPSVVLSVDPQDLNVVLQHAETTPAAQFDLIIATNVFVYYTLFEQSLAVVNLAKMLRPGGFLLSNDRLVELPASPLEWIAFTDVVYSDRLNSRDRLIWYQRR